MAECWCLEMERKGLGKHEGSRVVVAEKGTLEREGRPLEA